MLQDVIKAVTLNAVFNNIDVNGKEHIFIENKSGSLIHICPEDGVSRIILNSPQTNDYFVITYSWLSNKYYLATIGGEDFIEYDQNTGKIETYHLYSSGMFMYSNWSSDLVRYYPRPYVLMQSTDGHIYLGQDPVNTVFGYVRFNVLTKQFDEAVSTPDKELTHIHGKRFNTAHYIDTAGFAGVYSNYIWAPESDNYENLYDTVLEEITTAGLSLNNTGRFWIHYDDRALSSIKRRILWTVGAGNTMKIIDIKSPTTWIVWNNGTSPVDQNGTVVSTTNWILNQSFYNLATQAGVVAPTLEMGLSYQAARRIGRYVYTGHFYLGNKTHFFTFPIHPITKTAMYPYSFNKNEDYLRSSIYVYKCNFGGAYGFSSSDEIVAFLLADSNYWFIRPDTHTFVNYNPIADPDNYVIRAVNLENIDDPDGLGNYTISRFSENTIATIDGEDYFVISKTQSKWAMALTHSQYIYGNLADVGYRVIRKDNSALTFTYGAKGLFVSAIPPSQAIPLPSNRIACIGEIYSGGAFIDVIDEDTFTLKKHLTPAISPNGAIRYGNYIISYGYSGTTDVYDFSNWEDIKKFSLPTLATNEVMYVVGRSDGALAIGQHSRSVHFWTGLALTLIKPNTKTVTNLSTALPSEFNYQSAIQLRTALGLTGTTYTDETAETAFQTYMSNTGKSRATLIEELKGTCRWAGADLHTYGDKVVVGLSYRRILGLYNIRIETTPGSGIWIDEHFYLDGKCKALFIDKADILNLTSGDVKPVTFDVVGGRQSWGRVAGSTTYLAWLLNVPEDNRSEIRVVTKTAFEIAANGSGIITTIERQINVDLNSAGSIYYGFGNVNNFESYNTHRNNDFFCVGDNLYVTLLSNVDEGGYYPCVLKVNLATGDVTTFARSVNRRARTVAYEGTRMTITDGTAVKIVDNFESATLPITI